MIGKKVEYMHRSYGQTEFETRKGEVLDVYTETKNQSFLFMSDTKVKRMVSILDSETGRIKTMDFFMIYKVLE